MSTSIPIINLIIEDSLEEELDDVRELDSEETVNAYNTQVSLGNLEVIGEELNGESNDKLIDRVDNSYLESYKKYQDDFSSSTILPETILSGENFRYTIFPIAQEYRAIWDLYKKQISAFWVAEEIDLSKDINHWKLLDEGEKHFLKYVLAFFAASDGIVNTNLRERFCNDIKIKEAECFYTFQEAIENIHGEMYSILLDTFIHDKKESELMINAIQTIPCIKKKAIWCEKWIGSEKTFAHRVIAFAIVEGVFFSGSFASIFWLKNRDIMPGLIGSNTFIARDEGMHVEFACILYSLLKNRLKYDVVKEIMMEAVSIEKEFINIAIPCRMLGMNSQLMSQYIEYTADRLMNMLGYKKIYRSENPFEFMEKIDVDIKSNFFERRANSYQNANVGKNNSFRILDKF
jgi:ribonucleoside-diphosphate reductase subunit M2